MVTSRDFLGRGALDEKDAERLRGVILPYMNDRSLSSALSLLLLPRTGWVLRPSFYSPESMTALFTTEWLNIGKTQDCSNRREALRRPHCGAVASWTNRRPFVSFHWLSSHDVMALKGDITDRAEQAIAHARARFGVQQVKGKIFAPRRSMDLDGDGH